LRADVIDFEYTARGQCEKLTAISGSRSIRLGRRPNLARRVRFNLWVLTNPEGGVPVRHHFFIVVALAAALGSAGCAKTSADVDPKAIEAAYGISGAYVDQISTQDGEVDATIVPTTLEDGRKVQLVIPHKQVDPQYKVYMRDGVTITPLALADPSLAREQFVQSRPTVVERGVVARQPAPARKTRSTKDELLIIGGSAGAGTAIGAVAGGKKGAAIGAVSGGIAGLVYDLATRKKD
jgi:hypothetical protein